MKLLAVVCLLLGAGNLLSAFQENAHWWQAVLIGTAGSALIGLAVGILKKKIFAWPLGFACIGLGAVSFLYPILTFAEKTEGIERVVLLSASAFGALIVGAHFSRLWYLQRRYFSSEKEGP